MTKKKKNTGDQGGDKPPPNPQGGNQNKNNQKPPQQQQQQGGNQNNQKPPQQQQGDGKPRQQHPQQPGGQRIGSQQSAPQQAWGPSSSQHQGQPPPQRAPQQQQQRGGQQSKPNVPTQPQQQQRPPGFPTTQQPQWGQPQQAPTQQSLWRQPQQAPTQQQPSFFADKSFTQQQPQRQDKGKPQQKPVGGNQQQQRPTQSAQIEQPRPSGSVDSIAQGISSMELVKPTPNNMRIGTRGKPCKLKANFLPIKFNNLPETVFHYDVRFDPDVAKKFFSSAVDVFMTRHFKGVPYAHDGRANLYTAKKLDIKGQSMEDKVMAVIGERSKEYKVKIQFAREIDMRGLKSIVVPTGQQLRFDEKPLLAITALNIIIRKCFKQMIQERGAVSVASSLYMPPARPEPLGEGLELWYGLFQSVVMGQKSMYLNVDVSHKAFPSPLPLLDLLRTFTRDGQLPRDDRDRSFDALESHLKMLDVLYDRKTYRFNRLAQTAANEMFEMDTPQGKTRISVLNYLRNKGVTLSYPNYPCLSIGRIIVPLERCSIPGGQATNKKTTGRVTASIIKYSATTTGQRETKIQNLLSNVNYTNDLRDFGIDINKKFELVDGRVIDPPKLRYARNVSNVSRGVWRGGDFLETPQHSSIDWAIICCDNYVKMNDLQGVKRTISDAARRKNIMLTENPIMIETVALERNFERNFEDKLKMCSKNKDRTIVFVIIQDRMDNYAKVKQTAEQKVGILTQCIKSSTLRRLEGMTMDNILLKVNAKLSGKNHEIIENTFNKNAGIMFVGADVTHAGPDQRDIPSVVGVVSSYDKVGFKYQCSWRLQKKVKKDNQIEEMILDLEEMMVEHLTRYKLQNKQLPNKIMYYRDGVSEGQFKEVMQIEMNAIRKAMTRLYGPQTEKHAKVTFIVVQKRHHARFFPTQAEFTEGKFNNISPGTVVDKDIVDPYTFQFFLASHAAIQGVTKPAKYCVLLDESGFNADDLQAITYDLCHLFTRCNRSVSYPAPTYYAHLVAARGKQYIIGSRINMANMTTLMREYKNREIDATFNKTFPMFFV